jgi:hypothetical protein
VTADVIAAKDGSSRPVIRNKEESFAGRRIWNQILGALTVPAHAMGRLFQLHRSSFCEALHKSGRVGSKLLNANGAATLEDFSWSSKGIYDY